MARSMLLDLLFPQSVFEMGTTDFDRSCVPFIRFNGKKIFFDENLEYRTLDLYCAECKGYFYRIAFDMIEMGEAPREYIINLIREHIEEHYRMQREKALYGVPTLKKLPDGIRKIRIKNNTGG